MKEQYCEVEMDIVEFDCQDVINTSSAYIPPSTTLSPGEDQFW